MEKHRLSAFADGFLCGLGLILITWGLASLVSQPSNNAAVYIGLTLIGVFMFAGGGFREAYTWGKFQAQPIVPKKVPIKRTQPIVSPKPIGSQQYAKTTTEAVQNGQTDLNLGTTEQIRKQSVETQIHEPAIYEQEQHTQA